MIANVTLANSLQRGRRTPVVLRQAVRAFTSPALPALSCIVWIFALGAVASAGEVHAAEVAALGAILAVLACWLGATLHPPAPR